MEILRKNSSTGEILKEYEQAQLQSAHNFLTGVHTISQLIDVYLQEDAAEANNFLRDYEFVEPIACGVTSVVFKARKIKEVDQELDTESEFEPEPEFVAIKLILISSEQQFLDCRREVKIHSSFNHENIVQLLDARVSPKFAILVQEFVPHTLLAVAINLQKVKEGDCKFILHQISKALVHIHSLGFAHLDLKLDNVLISKDGVVKICDFGSAQKLQKIQHLQQGTLMFAAPETFSGVVCAKSDIWSLGVMAFVLLCGQLPFPAEDVCIRDRISSARFAFDKFGWSTVSKSGRDFVTRTLIIDCNVRFSALDCLNHPWLASAQLCLIESDSTLNSNEMKLMKKQMSCRNLYCQKVLENKIYIDLKSRSIEILPSKALARLAFEMLEKYVENVAKIIDKFLHLENLNKLEDKDESTTLAKSPKKLKVKSDVKTESFWLNDSEAAFCRICEDEFTFFKRKHHCRSCGLVVCNSCSKKKMNNKRHCVLCKLQH